MCEYLVTETKGCVELLVLLLHVASIFLVTEIESTLFVAAKPVLLLCLTKLAMMDRRRALIIPFSVEKDTFVSMDHGFVQVCLHAC